jgi:hypothetical protein
VAVLKLATDDNSLRDGIDYSLNGMLWEMAKTKQWDIFADPELTKHLVFEDILRSMSQPDTTITFDPNTYEEKIRISYDSRPLPFEAPRVKVRQILLYHNTTARFEVQTIAIAPCWNDDRVAFWLKVPTAPPNPPRPFGAHKNVSWAMRYTTEDTSPAKGHWTEIKNTTGDVLERFVDRIRNDTTVHLYDQNEALVLPRSRPCLFSCSDSVTVFDPQTWIEHNQVVQSGLEFEQFEELQLIEEWCWLEDQHRLCTRLVAVAPLAWVQHAGEPANRQPKFYRRCDE